MKALALKIPFGLASGVGAVAWTGLLLTGSPAQAVQTAQAGFAGAYAPSNWTLKSSGGGDGFVVTSAAPTQIRLASSKANGVRVGGASSSTTYLVTAKQSGIVSFNWSYSTTDPLYESFGYMLNGAYKQLAGLKNYSSGLASFSVRQGDVFGFNAYSVDQSYEGSFTTISNFSAPTEDSPVPAPLPLMGVAAAFAYSRKLRSRIKRVCSA